MQYSTFYPDILSQQISQYIQKYNDDDIAINLGHLIYIKSAECSIPIQKSVLLKINHFSDKTSAFILGRKIVLKDDKMDEFIAKIVITMMNIKPCEQCFKLILQDEDDKNICNICETGMICNLSIFDHQCAICQEKINKNPRILYCCGNMLHTNCYKIYKYKNTKDGCNHCEECDRHYLQCPYCRKCIHC
jgi:hypothetical protein